MQNLIGEYTYYWWDGVHHGNGSEDLSPVGPELRSIGFFIVSVVPITAVPHPSNSLRDYFCYIFSSLDPS